MHMVTASPHESFGAHIARRMVTQSAAVRVSASDLVPLRERAAALAPGIAVSRESVSEQLGYQQMMAAASIQRLWPDDQAMALVARETSQKAARGLSDAELESDAEGQDESPAPKG